MGKVKLREKIKQCIERNLGSIIRHPNKIKGRIYSLETTKGIYLITEFKDQNIILAVPEGGRLDRPYAYFVDKEKNNEYQESV